MPDGLPLRAAAGNRDAEAHFFAFAGGFSFASRSSSCFVRFAA
jgi:hypothetical protein